jgi:hypothetical protein
MLLLPTLVVVVWYRATERDKASIDLKATQDVEGFESLDLCIGMHRSIPYLHRST